MWFPDLFLAASGLALLSFGLFRLRRKALIEDTPTSTIRGVAMGMAELRGKAVQRSPLVSALSTTPCVWWRYLVEEEQRGSKGERRWVKVREDSSTDLFYLDDGTGRLAVDPMGAKMHIGFRRQWLGSGVAEGLSQAGFSLGRVSLSARLTLGGPARRYTEWLILPTGRLWVYGFVKSTRDAAADRRERVTQALRELKADPARLAACDADGDGRISAEEWERAADAVRRRVMEEELAEARPGAGPDGDAMMVCRGPQETAYYISDTGEEGALGALAWSGYAATFGGAALLLLGAASLLSRLGAIEGGWVIPWDAFLFRSRF